MSRLIDKLLNKTQNNKPSQQTTPTALKKESETTRHSGQEPDSNDIFSKTSPRLSQQQQQQQPNKYRRRALLPVEVQRPRTSGVGENEMIGNFLKRGGGGGDGGGKWKEST